MGAEGKVGGTSWIGIELFLRQHEVTAGCNQSVGRNLKFKGRTPLVAEIPAADIDGVRGRIEKLNRINVGQIGVSQYFGDQHRRDGGQGIVSSGRATDKSTGA